MKVWIQRADFSYDFDKRLKYEDAVELFESYDWESALKQKDDLEQARKDFCPPGMGIVHAKKGLLHIKPNKEGDYWVTLKYQKRRLIFFIDSHTRENRHVQKSDVLKVLEEFFG